MSFPGCEVALGRLQALCGGVADRVFSATGMREGEMWRSRQLKDIAQMLADLVQSEVIAIDEHPPWNWSTTASLEMSSALSLTHQAPTNGIAVHVNAMRATA